MALSPLIKDALEQSNEVFFAWGLQHISGRLKTESPFSSKDGEKEFEFYLSSAGAACIGDTFFIVRQNKKPRIIGAIHVSTKGAKTSAAMNPNTTEGNEAITSIVGLTTARTV